MILNLLIEIAISATLVIGAAFALIGSFGLLKLNTPMPRLHAPTKASTLGVGALLVSSMISAFAFGDGSMHEMLILAFLFVTAPISAHFMAKVHIHKSCTDPLPKPPVDTLWSTDDVPASDPAGRSTTVGDD